MITISLFCLSVRPFVRIIIRWWPLWWCWMLRTLKSPADEATSIAHTHTHVYSAAFVKQNPCITKTCVWRKNFTVPRVRTSITKARNVFFLKTPRPALRPTRLPIQWVSGLILRAKRSEAKSWHSGEVKNDETYASTPLMYLRGVGRFNLTATRAILVQMSQKCKLI